MAAKTFFHPPPMLIHANERENGVTNLFIFSPKDA